MQLFIFTRVIQVAGQRNLHLFIYRYNRHLELIFLLSLYLQAPSDIWLVTEDFTSSHQRELSVSRGQHVEVLDTSPNGTPDFCLVRHLIGEANSQSGTGAGNGQPVSEGLVPASALRPVSNLKVSNSGGVYSTAPENEGKFFFLKFNVFLFIFKIIHQGCIQNANLRLFGNLLYAHNITIICKCLHFQEPWATEAHFEILNASLVYLETVVLITTENGQRGKTTLYYHCYHCCTVSSEFLISRQFGPYSLWLKHPSQHAWNLENVSNAPNGTHFYLNPQNIDLHWIP